jgi:hypothetical protein
VCVHLMPVTVEHMQQRSANHGKPINAGPSDLSDKPNQHKKTPAKAGVFKKLYSIILDECSMLACP